MGGGVGRPQTPLRAIKAGKREMCYECVREGQLEMPVAEILCFFVVGGGIFVIIHS